MLKISPAMRPNCLRPKYLAIRKDIRSISTPMTRPMPRIIGKAAGPPTTAKAAHPADAKANIAKAT